MLKGVKIKKTIVFIILLVWYAAFASLWSTIANQLALYIALPLAFVLCVLQKDALILNKYIKILLILIIWIFLSYLWADYKVSAERQLKQLLGTMLLCYIYATIIKNEKTAPFLYITYIILFLGACIYAQRNILGEMDSGNSRLDDENLNANTLAYFLFYMTFAIYELKRFMNHKVLKITFDILFLLIIPISFVVAILTASRQVFIIQIPLIVILLYLRYLKHSSMKMKLVFFSVGALCAMMFLPDLLSIYDDSYLKSRNEISIKDDNRIRLMKEALDIGANNFILGVGPGNFVYYSSTGNFSHNVYLELFANHGIIGLILYAWMMLLFVVRQFRRYLQCRDKQYLVFLTFGVFYIIDGVFYVFYPHLWLMGAFILVASYSETYYRNHTGNEKTHSLLRLSNSKYPSR